MHLAIPDCRIIQPLPQLNTRLSVFVQRDDLLDPWLGGNKVYKLTLNLARCRAEGKRAVLTYGGAWSNHLVATAEACRRAGMQAIGIVRGDAFATNPRLDFLRQAGMQLVFISREQYRVRDTVEVQELIDRAVVHATGLDTDVILRIPEGGANEAGFLGSRSILDPRTSREFTHVILACGTGTTLAGVAATLGEGQQALGIAVVRDEARIRGRIRDFGAPLARLRLLEAYTCGGYAKTTPALLDFCKDFSARTQVPVEPVYTGKLFYALQHLLEENLFPDGSRILALHSGGIFPCDAPRKTQQEAEPPVSNS